MGSNTSSLSFLFSSHFNLVWCLFLAVLLFWISSHPFLWQLFISGPVLVMILEKENAIADWRALMGPTDARKAKTTHPYRLLCIIISYTSLCLVQINFRFKIFAQLRDNFMTSIVVISAIFFAWWNSFLFCTASEQCVVWTLKGIVFMDQILLNLHKEKYHFSSESCLQVNSNPIF